MKYNIIERKVKITDATKEKLYKKFDKFDRLFQEEATAHVTFKSENDRIYLEVTLQAGDMIIRAQTDDPDAKTAIDKIIDVIEGQFRKYKTKLEKKLRQGAFEEFVPFAEEQEPEETEFKVVKSKKFFMKPMSVDEAILQMNLLNHEFFVFTNCDSNKTNIVYRRKDKNYGLIETD